MRESTAKSLIQNIEEDLEYVKDKIDKFPEGETFPSKFTIQLAGIFAALEQLTAEM